MHDCSVGDKERTKTSALTSRRGEGGLSRGEFLGKGLKAGICLTSLAAFLSSCGITGQRQGGGAGGAGSISIAIGESPWLPSFEEIVRIYQEETGSTVDLQVFTFEGLLSKTLNAARTESSEFDIYTLNEGWCAEFYKAGLVVPFKDIDSGFELPDEVIEYQNVTRWNSGTDYFSADAPVYGVPINGNIQLLFYRKDLYERAGLPPPTTFEEAIESGKEIGQSEDVYGYAMRGQAAGYAVTYDFMPLLYGLGGDIFADPPNDYSVTINNEAGQRAVEIFLELLSYGPSKPTSVGQETLIALMQSGRLLQTHLASAAHSGMNDEAASSVVGKVGYAVVPKPAGGEYAPTAGIWTMGIPPQIEDAQKQAAYDFLTWLMAKDSQMKYAQSGGVVTRQDVYESRLADQEDLQYMTATADSTPYVRRGVDYPFSARLLEIVEQRLEDIAGGFLKPAEGLETIASETTKLVRELELPTR